MQSPERSASSEKERKEKKYTNPRNARPPSLKDGRLGKYKKINFNSMLGFRISLFGWGEGHYNILKKYRHLKTMTFKAFVMAN